MKLILNSRDPYNAVYRTENGQVLYRALSPFKFVNRRVNIDKVIPSKYDDMQDEFKRIAEIDFHTVSPSAITYENVRHSTNLFFRKGKFGLLGRDQIFEGPDGEEYRWVLTSNNPELRTNDEAQILLARFTQQQGFTNINIGTPATLEIFPEGENLIDLIIITLAYVEKYRRDRERGQAI